MSRPAGLPFGSPGLIELVAGLRDFFAEDVVPSLDEPLRYHVRVAVGVLALVARELELGPAYVQVHEARLRAFGVGDDVELAAAIRLGVLDDRFDELRSMLLADASDRVAVTDPSELAAEAEG